MTIIRAAVPALVAHAFVPFSTQCLPSRVACDRSDAASEPDSASESANPASSSPRAIGFSQRSLCSGVPCFTSIVVGIALWIPTETAMEESAAEISSSSIRYVTVSRPMPSYSSGVHMPRKPSLPSSSMTSRGKWLVRSHSAANGSIFSRANSRASSTTCSRTSVAVGIEPLPRFSAELSWGVHFLEQRRGPVLVRVDPVLQHLHDREADIEANQIGEGQWTERVIHAELHDLIDRLRRRYALVYTEDRFIDHRHQHAVRHESGRVVDQDRRLSQLLGNLDRFCDDLVPRPPSPHYFDERHEGHRIHEMHPDDAFGAPGLLGDFRDRYRRGVGREDRAVGGQTVQVLEDVELDVWVLGGCFHHELGVLRRIERRAGFDSRERFCSLLRAPRSLFHQPLDVRRYRLERAIQRVLCNVHQRDVPSLLRKHVGDPVAHRSSAHDRNFAHAATCTGAGAAAGVNAPFRVSRKSVPRTEHERKSNGEGSHEGTERDASQPGDEDRPTPSHVGPGALIE